ncbi:MAG: class I adenylate-forming enzyme family protein [Microbacteriaceae bacterium]
MNPLDPFFDHARAQPDAIALSSPRTTLTFAQLADSVARFASQFQAKGVRRGSVVGVALPAEADAVAILAIQMLGAVSLRITEPIAKAYGDHIDMVVTDGLVRGAATKPTITVDAAFFESLGTVRPLESPVAVDEGDLCRIVFSSGTTGTPKGVPFTAKYLVDRVDSATRNWIPAVPFMSLLGLDTVTGFQTFIWAMRSGQTFFITSDAAANLAQIVNGRVAAIKTSPARLADLVGVAGDAQTQLSVIEVAGSLLPASLAAVCERVFGVTPTYLYGSTEVGTVTRGTVDPAHPNMVGAVVGEIDAEIVDDNGTALPRGIEGLLRFRKPGMPAGYWNVSVPTGHSGFRDGWFYPGDYGQIDSDGRLWLAGRRDDLVNAGGAKFNLIELDRWLQDCGLFLDAASFQFVDNRGAESVGIAFVTKNAPEPEILTARVREFLPDLQFGALLRLNEIPRNQLGKVNRTLLTQKLNPSKGR